MQITILLLFFKSLINLDDSIKLILRIIQSMDAYFSYRQDQ